MSSSHHSVCFHFTHIPRDFFKGYFPINSPLDLLLAIRQDSWFLQIVSPIHSIKIFCLVTPHPLSWDNTLWLCCTFQCTFLLLIRPPSSKKGWCSQSMLTSSALRKISQIPKVPGDASVYMSHFLHLTDVNDSHMVGLILLYRNEQNLRAQKLMNVLIQ